MHLTIGDVILWNDFPYPKAGDIKARWFIYLGRTTMIATPVFAYLCTTTTRFEKFERGGSRGHHACRRFLAREYPVFEQDCILDFDESPYYLPMEMLDRCAYRVTMKGRLNESDMRNIYKQFLRSHCVSRAQMMDIHESFNLAGITGLKRP